MSARYGVGLEVPVWLTPMAAWAADPVVDELIAKGRAQTEAYEELVELCDDIGARLSGSPQLERAVEWSADKMREDGLEVELQPVEVPRWVRGPESARLTAPVEEPLEVLGLGMTVPGEVSGTVVVARDWDALEALGERVRGNIVLFDPPWHGYGDTVQYRTRGPDRAAAMGARAVLLRSVTTGSLHTAHTGTLSYRDPASGIPAAAIPTESADRIRRWWDRGIEVRIALSLQSERLEDAPSFNVVGQVTGRKKDEVVLLGCHLDSWDVGTGAQDDGAACVAVMEAVAQVAAVGRKPRRTVRAVLFTNEENGLAGGKAYAEANADLEHVALIESDTGMGGTLGYRVTRRDLDHGSEAARALARDVAALLAPLESLGMDQFEPGYAGADVGPTLRDHGGLGLGVKHDMSEYWLIHHTHADTVDKIDPANLQVEVAGLAATAWILANAKELPR